MTARNRASVSVGHWTDEVRRTGCTVILFDRLCPAVVDVRGGAPGTRETDLLTSDRLVRAVDAILLTGGSAFGLAAADGVMRFLSERSRGYATSAARIPIVPAAVIYDLDVGAVAWPSADHGYTACLAAVPVDRAAFGPVGAGTGATYRKLWSVADPLAGGIGRATHGLEGAAVTAFAVVNAVGDVPTSLDPDRRAELLVGSNTPGEGKATTLVAVIVEADCDERTLRRVAVAAHDGMARAIVPCHTIWDGDLVLAVQTGETREIDPTQTMRIAIAAELAVEESIRNAVGRQAP